MSGRPARSPRSLVWIRDSSTPLFVINQRRQVASFNLGCERITGWSAEDVLGRRVEAVTADNLDSVAAVFAALMPPLECWQGQPTQATVLFPRKGEEAAFRIVQFWPIRDPDGAVNVILGIVDESGALTTARPPTLAQAMHAELAALRLELRRRYGFSGLIGQSPALRKAFEQVRIAQGTTAAVLLVGEAGTGREHLARVIHQGGPTARRVFVRIDGRSTPSLEIKRILRLAAERRSSEADQQPGTLFFADLDAAALDVFERLEDWVAADHEDVRLMASTKSDLSERVAAGRFPEALWHRLTTQIISLPPLRDRPDDLRPLAQCFLEEHNRSADRQVAGFADDVWPQLARYQWLGNLDELATVIQEARAACTTDLLEVDHLPFRFRTGMDAQRLGPSPRRVIPPLDQTLEQTERELIAAALEEVRGNITLAAERLGINRARLYRRMEQLGIGEEKGKSE